MTAAVDAAELLPGYRVEPETGAWLTLPWPGDLADLPSSLGPDVIRWCYGEATPLVAAAEGPRLRHHLTGQPWRFTPGQRRFLHMWFAVDVDGEWLYRSFVKRGAKGSGKDPLCASMLLIAALGPVVLRDIDKGRPVGEPHGMALVQIGANSEAQAKDVLRVANGMIGSALRLERYVDAGITRTEFGGGTRIELLTASEKSAEGDPATDNFLNETHHMTWSSGGQSLAAVARRNVAKSPGGHARTGEFTNSHLPGEGSVAEDSTNAWQLQVSGQTEFADILYDSREAPPHLSLHVAEQRQAGFAAAYADAPWVSLRRIERDALDPRTPPADSIRYYFNGLPTNETAWVEPRKWDALARPDFVVADREPLAMFVDCSKSSDATVIAGCRISDGHVLALGAWQRPHGDRGKGWLAPRSEVDAVLRSMFELYDIQWNGVDPSPARDDETEANYWAALVDEWHRDFRDTVLLWATPGSAERRGHSMLFDMRQSTPGAHDRLRRFTGEAEATASAIDEDCTLTHDGDPMMRLHVHNARRRPNQWGVSLGKQTRDSNRLVDYAVAMVGARMGRRLVLNSGKTRSRKRTGVVW